jgi:hypothetical protein
VDTVSSRCSEGCLSEQDLPLRTPDVEQCVLKLPTVSRCKQHFFTHATKCYSMNGGSLLNKTFHSSLVARAIFNDQKIFSSYLSEISSVMGIMSTQNE